MIIHLSCGSVDKAGLIYLLYFLLGQKNSLFPKKGQVDGKRVSFLIALANRDVYDNRKRIKMSRALEEVFT